MPQRTVRPEEILGTVDSRPAQRTVSLADIVGPAETEPADSRSWFARGVDALSEPLIPQIAAAGRSIGEHWSQPGLHTGRAAAMIRGGLGGLVEGASNVVGSLTSPLGVAATVSGVAGPRFAAAGLPAIARALGGVEAATGAAFGARGLEQAADAKTLPEAALGVAMAAGGALGARAGTQGFLRTGTPRVPVPPPPRGFLRTGPGFVAGESGPAARFGETIPMERAPDGSYVHSVPGEYARREVRGVLGPARGFVADESGAVVPTAQAGELHGGRMLTGRVSERDPSGGGSLDAAPLAYEYQGRSLVPSRYSGEPHATAAATLPPLTPQETHALNWIAADLEHIPFSKRNFNEAPIGRGGDLEVSGGAAGAPIYQTIIGDVSRAGRSDVLTATRNLLEGKRTPTGDLVLGVARDLAEGTPSVVRQMTLPPEAGGDVAGTRFARARSTAEDAGFDRFSSAVDDSARAHARTIRPEDIVGPVFRHPGEEGAISPELTARIGLGGAGAAYGAATGEDTTDRLKRAALFGAAGFAAPSLIRSAPMAARLAETTAAHSVAGEARGPIPPAGEIPANKLHTMPALTEQVQAAADDLLARYAGFEAQRRGVQSVPRTEALSDRVRVNTETPLAPGTALNAERMRAYQNATATLLQKVQTLERAVADGPATPAQRLELETTRSEARVLTQSFRGAASEAGRALHILRYQARILASADPEAMREAVQIAQRGLSGDLQAYYYANILSGIGTHERNILGNLSNAIFNLAANPFAVGADVARSAATGQARQVFLGELPARIAGTVTALPRAFANALEVLKTGVPQSNVSTFDRPVSPEFRGGGTNPFNWPGRALEAMDDLFGTLAAEQTLYGAAFAQAKTEGLHGPALLDAVARYKTHPSEAILQEVAAQRARLLFREDPGALAQAVLAAKRHVPALGYVVPFVRVPANIIRQGFEASPAGFGMSAARQGGRSGADAMGRAALGTVVLAPLAYWAAAGKITGDPPRDPAQRAAFYESGMRPNSIQVGDTWYSYQAISPLNVPLSFVANGFHTWRDAQHDPDSTADQIAKDVVLRTAGSLLDQSFLSGVSALVDALGDPERYGSRFVQQLATGFVPFSGALRTVAQSTDPYVRTPHSIVQGVQAIIPGQSQSLEPRLTRFGEPVERNAEPFNVFKPSPVMRDPVADELAAHDVPLRPAAGRKDIALGQKVTIPLTLKEQTAMGQASGRAVRQILERVIEAPMYQQASPAAQETLLHDAIASARGTVNEQIRRELMARMMRTAR